MLKIFRRTTPPTKTFYTLRSVSEHRSSGREVGTNTNGEANSKDAVVSEDTEKYGRQHVRTRGRTYHIVPAQHACASIFRTENISLFHLFSVDNVL